MCFFPSPGSLELEWSAEREEHQALLIALLRVERQPELDAQRANRRQPTHAAARGAAGRVERAARLGRVGVAGVEEDHALQADALQQGKDDLVVEDHLLAAADRRSLHHLAELVAGQLARAHGARLEAADRADAAGEIPL